MSEFDAVLLASFGGPRGMADVMPFLRNVTAGRDVPEHRLSVVAEQYEAMAGVSPINDQNELLARRLGATLAAQYGRDLPVYVGNRNWGPYFVDALRQMKSDHVQHAAVVITSGYASYSGCRQYREDLFEAREQVPHGAQLTRIRRWFDQPEFAEVVADGIAAQLAETSGERVVVLFSTHSLPSAMAASSGDPVLGGNAYQREHQWAAAEVARLLAQRGQPIRWELVYQSRSGSPRTPWLTPDVGDRIKELADDVDAVIVSPIGFMSDHMEVVWDLDTQAREVASAAGVEFLRAPTVGADQRFVGALARMVVETERDLPRSEQVSYAPCGAAPSTCPPACCPNPAGPRPALFGSDEVDD